MHTDTDLTEEEIEASDELISEYEHNIEGSEIESSSHSPLEIDKRIMSPRLIQFMPRLKKHLKPIASWIVNCSLHRVCHLC